MASHLEVTVLDERERVVGSWASEAAEYGAVHRVGGRTWFRAPGPHRISVTASFDDASSFRVEVPVNLRGDERLVWVHVGGHREHRVEIRLLVPSDDVRLRFASTDTTPNSSAYSELAPLEIVNDGDGAIEGLGFPAGWFQAVWVDTDGDDVTGLPPPFAYCGTMLMPQPPLPPGRRAPAGDSPWAMGARSRSGIAADHAFVPFARSRSAVERWSGAQAGVEWRVIRLSAAELDLEGSTAAGR
jgi:hypothetical protein